MDSHTDLHTALAFAERVHRGTHKKGTTYPFLYHPLAVASLVLKHGGSPAQAQAALLHDTIGDPDVTEDLLARQFGPDVARLAFSFADPPEAQGADWQKTRELYLAKLMSLDDAALLVVACEELHELGELLSDLRRYGADVWKRFPVPSNAVFWYFRELLVLFNRRLNTAATQPLVSEFGSLVRQFKAGLFDGHSL